MKLAAIPKFPSVSIKNIFKEKKKRAVSGGGGINKECEKARLEEEKRRERNQHQEPFE